MNVKFKKLHTYIHVYEVKGLHDFLARFEDEFYNIYQTQSQDLERDQLNTFIYNPYIKFPLFRLLNYIVSNFYIVKDNLKELDLMLYTQSHSEGEVGSVFHNHNEDSTITSTMYLNPPLPNEGGGLEFYFHDYGKEIIYPNKDEVYFFPSWVLHKPLPQTSNKIRYCLNWGYDCSNRPIHKLTNTRW